MATGRHKKSEIVASPRDRGRDKHWIGLLALAFAFAALGWVTPLCGQDQRPIVDDNDPRVKVAVARAATFLRARGTPPQVGELSLSINALAKIRDKFPDLLPADDPVLKEMVAALRARCLPNFQPTLQGGHDNYEAGCAAMALAAADRQAHAPELSSVAQYILEKQLPNGAWSYDARAPGGDTSMTQYALLGLWEANNAGGGPIRKPAWDRAAHWLVTNQGKDGGFVYHPAPLVQSPTTHTMTAASLGSLYLCRDHLPGGKPRDNRGVLQPVEPKQAADKFNPQIKPQAIQNAIDTATKWMTANFTLDKARGESDPGGGRWFYYYLYALERCATLADQRVIADVDWYSKGAELILARQQANGSWSAGNGDTIDSSFAVLFLVRSTKQILKVNPPYNLGPGTLVIFDPNKLPGRGKDAGLFGPIDAEGADRAAKDSKGIAPGSRNWLVLGPKAVRPWKELEQGYAANDSIRIVVALNDLARTHDMRVVPLLIDALYYEDSERVVLAARESLCFISRRIEGPYTGATVEDWEAEIAKWKAWYRSVRPQADVDDDVLLK